MEPLYSRVWNWSINTLRLYQNESGYSLTIRAGLNTNTTDGDSHTRQLLKFNSQLFDTFFEVHGLVAAFIVVCSIEALYGTDWAGVPACHAVPTTIFYRFVAYERGVNQNGDQSYP